MANDAFYGVYIGYPQGYISEFNGQHSLLKNEQGQIITPFGGRNASGAGLGEGVQNSPKANMPIPAKIEVMWFSVVENKFWQGEFLLPKDQLEKAFTQDKMLGVFTGTGGSKINKYDELIVNVAPEGKVYIYVGGFATKLIGSYQAQAIDYDWLQHVEDTWAIIDRSHIESQEEYREIAIRADKKLIDNISKNYNEDYFTPVKWTFDIKGDKKISAYAANTMNGEYVHVLDNPVSQEMNSIPKEIVFDVNENNTVNRYNLVLPNMYEFYKKHFRNDELVEITVDFPRPDYCILHFKQGEKVIELEDFSSQEVNRNI